MKHKTDSVTHLAFDNNNAREMPKNPGLRLFTKAWAPRRDQDFDEGGRPLTATLERPTVLNINLIGKIDMSTVRKEFLNISNLCRIPFAIAVRSRRASISRPLSLPPPAGATPASGGGPGPAEGAAVRRPKKKDNDNNNNKVRHLRKRVGNRKGVHPSSLSSSSSMTTTTVNLAKSTKLPEPCTTCGRSDQPERFHSHPTTPLRPGKKPDEAAKIPMKSTVQKPIAIKYKSKQNMERRVLPPPARKPSLPAQNLVHTPPSTAAPPENGAPSGRTRSARRSLVCFVCGREFGTASLPLHEPKCLKKWERENPGRQLPTKPEGPLSQEAWNKFAWEASQAILEPCANCGRTFFPDRLMVHQKSCKILQTTNNNSNSKQPSPDCAPDKQPSTPASPSSMPPPAVECYICGKKYGTHSIEIHERKCLKKWQQKNDRLPPRLRAPPPQRRESPKSQEAPLASPAPPRAGVSGTRPPTPRRPTMFPCYLCGRLFSINSIYIHEPQCLKLWKVENDKLPPSKRRPPPLKPDVKFTHDGSVDFAAASEANWQSHLSQLVPCKLCKRTFNPDRVHVHERSCKG